MPLQRLSAVSSAAGSLEEDEDGVADGPAGDIAHALAESSSFVPLAAAASMAFSPEADMAQKRRELAASRRRALQWITDGEALHQVWLLRSALEPQRRFMETMLHSVSSKAQLDAADASLQGEAASFRVLNMRHPQHFVDMLASAMEVFLEGGRADMAGETDHMRSQVFRVSFRPVAVVFQLIANPYLTLPQVFRLVGQRHCFSCGR